MKIVQTKTPKGQTRMKEIAQEQGRGLLRVWPKSSGVSASLKLADGREIEVHFTDDDCIRIQEAHSR